MNTPPPSKIFAEALWLQMASMMGGKYWLANGECDVKLINIEDKFFPVCIPQQSEQAQTYVLSLQSAWIDYAKVEATKHCAAGLLPLLTFIVNITLSPLLFLLQGSRLHKSVILANHLISTNLYTDWDEKTVSNFTEKLSTEYKNRALTLRNICPEINPRLTEALRKNGWYLVPARMIYLCNPADINVWKHNHIKQDAKLLASKNLQIVEPNNLTRNDLTELRTLFRQLFIDKHSHLNPDFTPAFFELCLENNFLDLYAIRYLGRLVGVIGIYHNTETNWITTPLIGYDTNLPSSLGIYRCLMALLLRQAKQRNAQLHYSSGAKKFKQTRGGQEHLEYTAIYTKHLPFFNRLSSKAFSKILQLSLPKLLKNY